MNAVDKPKRVEEIKALDAKALDIDQLLRRREVEALTRLSRSTIYNYIHQDRFPKPRRCGSRAVRWAASDVAAWIASTKAEA